MISLIAATTVAANVWAGDDINSASYDVDITSSTIQWHAKKVTGAHTGMISISEGTLDFTAEKLTGGSFKIDMNSITCTDLTNENMNQKLVGHLKSDDFFGVNAHPFATLVINEVQHVSANEYNILGDITIKGHTEEVEFGATITAVDDIVNALGTMTLDRSKFNVTYNSGSFFENLGDKLIYDEFDLNISLTATKTSSL